MKKNVENIKSWALFWLSAFIVLLLWAITYSALENVWTPNQNLVVEEWATLTSDSWNKILGNIESLNTKIDTNINEVNWKIDDIKNNNKPNYSWNDQFITESYKLVWNWNASTWNCHKIILPEECISENSDDLAPACTMSFSQYYLPWNKTPWSWAHRARLWSLDFNFKIYPRGVDKNHESWKVRILSWVASSWTAFYTRTTTHLGSANYSWSIQYAYLMMLWRDEWASCPEFSEWAARNYNSNPKKNPREVIIAARNDFTWIFTVKSPISKDDSYFKEIIKN